MIDHDLGLVEPVLEPLLACLDGLCAVARGLPPHYADQEALIAAFRDLWARQHFNLERLEDLHRAVQVGGRYLARPLAEYEQLIGSLYDAALDTRRMTDSLQRLRALFQANFVTALRVIRAALSRLPAPPCAAACNATTAPGARPA